MDFKKQVIRLFFYSTLAVTLITFLPSLALSQTPLDKVIEGAKKEQKLVVYASYTYEEGDVFHAAFKKKYPFIKDIEHFALGAADVTTRVLMESQAGNSGADVALTGAPLMGPLQEREFLRKVDWSALGASPESVNNAYQITIATITSVIAYNSKLVSPADVPKNWEDLLDAKWEGKIGLWAVPFAFADLASAWGPGRTVEYLKSLMNNKAIVISKGREIATRLGAGEFSVTIIMNDVIETIRRKGAPVVSVWPDPLPVERYDACLPKLGAHPNAGTLFSLWSATSEATQLFEKLRGRGNVFSEGTPTAEMTKGKKYSYWPMDKLEERKKVIKELKNVLMK